MQSLKLFHETHRTPVPICKTNYCSFKLSSKREVIRQDIGNSLYTIKVDGAKDSTYLQNIFIIIRFANKHSLKVAERLLI